MAKTKAQMEKEAKLKEEANSSVNVDTVPEVAEPKVEAKPEINLNDLMGVIVKLQEQVNSFQSIIQEKNNEIEKDKAEMEEMKKEIENEKIKKAENKNINMVDDSANIPVYSSVLEVREDKTDRLLEYLANKKSDKEVVIVHNREVMSGGSTAIRLTGLSIDFHKLGEERTLSWQQFEECVSKYRRFFEKEIILLSDEYSELSERYSVPCVKRKGGTHPLVRSELLNIEKKDVHSLETYFNSLSKEDQSFLCSYWLGKCYEKAPGFYDRYKIELLNRLQNVHLFDNLLTLMNGDFRNEA